ncbi:hypothetical protein OF83DRAFT_1084094 [Amylostereum chailletii]|nr:hypothetical protein OF83DRAFT_1084094 [Amylostereum chailletii]
MPGDLSHPALSHKQRKELRPGCPAGYQGNDVTFGHHVGRTVHTYLVADTLLQSVRSFLRDLSSDPYRLYTEHDVQDYSTFLQLSETMSGLEARVMQCSEKECSKLGSDIRRGANTARSTDTRGFKENIIAWIQEDGKPVMTLDRKKKSDRGFHNDSTGRFLCPVSMDWDDPENKDYLRKGYSTKEYGLPTFLWERCEHDPENIWKGFLRSDILQCSLNDKQGMKYVFTGPSSVKGSSQATRLGNAEINGMTRVTPGSIAYIAMQVYFALSSEKTLKCTSKAAVLYEVLLADYLYNEEYSEEVGDLLAWWDKQIFPGTCGKSHQRQAPSQEVARAKIEEKLLTLQTVLAAVSQV